MIETGIPDIDVDELMAKIRAEIRNRPDRTYGSGRFGTGGDLRAVLDFPLPEKPKKPFEEKKEGYTVADFLQYHGTSFVINAYRGILSRPADAGGSDHFLSELDSGKMTKAEILGRLRYSPEGRARGVRIRGLLPAFCIHSLFRVPVLGYACRLIIGMLNLPTVIRNVQNLESHSAAQWERHDQQLHEVAEQVRRAMERMGISEAEWRACVEERIEMLERESLPKTAARDDGSGQEDRGDKADRADRD